MKRRAGRIGKTAVAAAALALVGLVACGDRTSLDADLLSGGGGGSSGDDGGGSTLPAGCGDGACKGGETCVNCSVDCGVCKGCGDGKCDGARGETCNSCPEDCGVCPGKCGDGFCNGNETCENCAPDCGKCAGCGDGKCDPPKEDCFTCLEDCGACKGCGDGICEGNETCASCPHDCGVCAVCGNNKCESPYETCVNCSQDCGQCATQGCFQMLTCAFGCIDTSTQPPTVSVSCVGTCVARGCPSAQFFFDQAFNCFLKHLPQCGNNFSCLQKACDSEVAACLASHC